MQPNCSPIWWVIDIDVPAGRSEWASFWARVTRATLPEPFDGPDDVVLLRLGAATPYLQIRRTDTGPPGIRPELCVRDVDALQERAQSLGAALRESSGTRVTMRSPGGQQFVLRTPPAGGRGPGDRHPDARLDQLCLDVPPGRWDDELAFWAELTGCRPIQQESREFVLLERAQGVPVQVLLQRLDDPDAAPDAHLDWAADDRDAEVARHLDAGAGLVGPGRSWSVLRAPDGRRYCITGRDHRTGR